jgi:uncharacterized membrane protein
VPGVRQILVVGGPTMGEVVRGPAASGRKTMGLILVILLLALVFGGLGFVYPVLWIVALVLFAGWALGLSRSRGHARTS